MSSSSQPKMTPTSILIALNILQLLISGFVFIALSIIIISILISPKTRTQPYNLYLISLELVDAMMNAMLVITIVYYWMTLQETFNNNKLINFDPYETSTSSSDDELRRLRHVKVFWVITNSIVIFATTVNMYLSAIVAYHIYRLLQSSFLARQIRPPTTTRILYETGIVYVFATFIALFYGWSSTMVRLSNEEDYNNFLMAWCVGISCGIIVPFCFIAYVTIRIWQRKLLHLSERRTRTITIYFGRIVFVFIAFYIPGTILFALGVSTLEGSARWTRIAGTILFSLQGAFSFVVALTKPDIQEAVSEFLRCNSFNFIHHRKKAAAARESNIDDNNNNNNNNNNNGETVVVEEKTVNRSKHYLVAAQQNNLTRRESIPVDEAPTS